MVGDDAIVSTRRRAALIALNVVGGLCVLGSYAHGYVTYPQHRAALWGDLPESLRPVYTVAMLLAAGGYFPLTYALVLRPNPAALRLGERRGVGSLLVMYALVLIPSALWLPMTYAMLESPSLPLWVAIRAVLFAVAAGSVGLAWATLVLRPAPPRALGLAARVGATCFTFQTAILDALVWPAFFPLP